MGSLEKLDMTICFTDGQSGGADLLAQVLTHVKSPHFRTCVIKLETYKHRKYWCDRPDLLNTISGEAMKQCLQHMPSISDFCISLDDNNTAFGERWWTTETIKSLPAMKDALTIHVDVHASGVSNSSSNSGQCTHTLIR